MKSKAIRSLISLVKSIYNVRKRKLKRMKLAFDKLKSQKPKLKKSAESKCAITMISSENTNRIRLKSKRKSSKCPNTQIKWRNYRWEMKRIDRNWSQRARIKPRFRKHLKNCRRSTIRFYVTQRNSRNNSRSNKINWISLFKKKKKKMSHWERWRIESIMKTPSSSRKRKISKRNSFLLKKLS